MGNRLNESEPAMTPLQPAFAGITLEAPAGWSGGDRRERLHERSHGNRNSGVRPTAADDLSPGRLHKNELSFRKVALQDLHHRLVEQGRRQQQRNWRSPDHGFSRYTICCVTREPSSCTTIVAESTRLSTRPRLATFCEKNRGPSPERSFPVASICAIIRVNGASSRA